jgi:polyisoprenoid-binding protein YceI
VNFKVRHLFTKVTGSFQEVAGTIQFDPAMPEKGSIEVTIQAASIFTKNEKRDNHLKSADFFDVEKHPELTFKSTKIEKKGEMFLVTGDLTMHGMTKPVTLEAEFLGAGPHVRPGSEVAGFTAQTKVDRKEWGILWNRALDTGGTILGDEVEILLDVEAIHTPPASEEGTKEGGW